MRSVPTVLAIGSCRVFRPLRQLHKVGRISLVNAGPDESWFTHTAPAAVQYLEVMNGTVAIPLPLREAALESPFQEWTEDMARTIPAADVTVVEVCSLKEHRVGSIHVNAHKVYGIANKSGVDHQAILNGTTEALSNEHPLKNLVVERTSEETLVHRLSTIAELRAAPVVAVDHLFALGHNGLPIAAREELTQLLSVASREAGALFHSTRPTIEAHGQDVALLDVNHYRNEFELTVGEALLASIDSLK